MFNDLEYIRGKPMWASCFINTNVINNVNYFLLISGSNKETVFISVPEVSGKVLICRINFGLKFTSNRGEIFIKRVGNLFNISRYFIVNYYRGWRYFLCGSYINN